MFLQGRQAVVWPSVWPRSAGHGERGVGRLRCLAVSSGAQGLSWVRTVRMHRAVRRGGEESRTAFLVKRQLDTPTSYRDDVAAMLDAADTASRVLTDTKLRQRRSMPTTAHI